MEWPEFERFCQIKGLRPICKLEEKKATIGIAETDYENDKRDAHPWGYYQTVYAVAGKASQGKVDVAQWLEFDALHDKDKDWSQETKRQARINVTIKIAKEFVEKNIEAGRYG